MFDILKVRYRHGHQAIPDVRAAKPPEGFRGLPVIDASPCASCPDGLKCIDACPTGALTESTVRRDESAAGDGGREIDLGKCLLCGDCARACPDGAIQFSGSCRLAADSRKSLIVGSDSSPEDFKAQAVKTRKDIARMFGGSLKLRSVSAGGCNGCELELNACGNVNFDMGRFGIDIVASPRHADGMIVTGPVSAGMASALEDTWLAIPEPKILILAGPCAISGGVFSRSQSIDRTFLSTLRPDLYVPGCPVHPLSIINGILDLLGR